MIIDDKFIIAKANWFNISLYYYFNIITQNSKYLDYATYVLQINYNIIVYFFHDLLHN